MRKGTRYIELARSVDRLTYSRLSLYTAVAVAVLLTPDLRLPELLQHDEVWCQLSFTSDVVVRRKCLTIGRRQALRLYIMHLLLQF